MKKLLIANRGEIARRIIKTARSMGIETVAVFADLDAAAPYVFEADEAIRLPGRTAAETYLRGDLVIDAALTAGADAVHPGYGFLSESAAFARSCVDAGLSFIGPPAAAIETMGSKLAAKQIAERAGVSVLRTVEIPDLDVFDEGECTKACADIGWPVLVKASAGGGGRGMRVVESPDQLTEAIRSARREARAAFGDGTVFVEKFIRPARHVEIQVLADMHGRATHLFERECSIQRRHQKVLEEAPSPSLSDEARERMGAAAVSLAVAVGYVGVGTVEFVLGPGEEFHFLEMNTRLQVEHPVTEATTGIDLVRAQLLVADGAHLESLTHDLQQSGHAIEVRLYAEDPATDFLPDAGVLHVFDLDPTNQIRVDSAYAAGDTVSTEFDGMLAKLISHAPTRVEAASLLRDALRRSHVGGVRTNLELLINLLGDPDFLAGPVNTDFLTDPARRDLLSPRVTKEEAGLHAVVAAIARQAQNRDSARVQATIPSGWRNNPTQRQHVRFEGTTGMCDVHYRVHPTITASVDGVEFDIESAAWQDDWVALTVSGRRRRFIARRAGLTWYVASLEGTSELMERPLTHGPAGTVTDRVVTAPLPGTVVGVSCQEGERVAAGQTLVVLESMKMEHSLHAPRDGVISQLLATVGSRVEAGQRIVVIDDAIAER